MPSARSRAQLLQIQSQADSARHRVLRTSVFARSCFFGREPHTRDVSEHVGDHLSDELLEEGADPDVSGQQPRPRFTIGDLYRPHFSPDEEPLSVAADVRAVTAKAGAAGWVHNRRLPTGKADRGGVGEELGCEEESDGDAGSAWVPWDSGLAGIEDRERGIGEGLVSGSSLFFRPGSGAVPDVCGRAADKTRESGKGAAGSRSGAGSAGLRGEHTIDHTSGGGKVSSGDAGRIRGIVDEDREWLAERDNEARERHDQVRRQQDRLSAPARAHADGDWDESCSDEDWCSGEGASREEDADAVGRGRPTSVPGATCMAALVFGCRVLG